MCGIAGIITPNAARCREALDRMVAALHHRGPDQRGTCFFKSAALGHTRLSIVDLEGGRQPMISQDGGAAVTFNGEIYGYQQIRRQLRDYPFQTFSDTEVILALYDRHGPELLDRLPGMFAFALWDNHRRVLLCARDRFGEKPFYYAVGTHGELVFASELKAIIASRLVKPTISASSLVHYLRHLYIHPGTTVYGNVHSLPPAHILTWRDGRIEIRRYWDLPEMTQSIGLSEAAEQFRELFEQAVRRQLVADVPVGAFLSGGLDSSSIVAAAATSKTNLRTYCFDFGHGSGNRESPYARAMARMHRTDHRELQTQKFEVADMLVRMPEIYDEPFADSSNIPTYLICQAARHDVKVVLTGDGGDELLAGYDFWYRPLLEMEQTHRPSRTPVFFKRVAGSVMRQFGLGALAELLPPSRGGALRREYGTLSNAHAALQTYFNAASLRRLGLPDQACTGHFRALPNVQPHYDDVDGALRNDLQKYMPGDILVKIDRASMAHGLELRAPFLDVDFATYCISLPHRLKIDRQHDKLILRQAYSDRWPPTVRNRSKQGFGAPVRRWLRLPGVRELKNDCLTTRNRRLYDFLSYRGVQTLISKDDYRTWILLVLSLWLESHPYPVHAS